MRRQPSPGPAGAERTHGWDDFAPLYDEHHERLYRVAMLLCHGSEQLAEDAVTETFLRIYPAWADGRVEAFFPAARQVLVNHVLGGHLGAASMQPSTRRGAADRPLDESITDAATTFQLLEQLPPQQRTAVVLRYFEDLDDGQIASTMGIPLESARHEVAAGLHQMRTLMGEEGVAS